VRSCNSNWAPETLATPLATSAFLAVCVPLPSNVTSASSLSSIALPAQSVALNSPNTNQTTGQESFFSFSRSVTFNSFQALASVEQLVDWVCMNSPMDCTRPLSHPIWSRCVHAASHRHPNSGLTAPCVPTSSKHIATRIPHHKPRSHLRHGPTMIPV
jgi:hypothetical protein